MFVRLAALTAVVLWTLTASAATAQALGARAAKAPICSIVGVQAHGDSVVITFEKFQGLYMLKPDGRSAAQQIDRDGRLRARLGQRLRASRTPEDRCTMDIVRLDGRIGVKAEYISFWAQGRRGSDSPSNPHVVKQFIPAR
jgi:hypothetical protein